MITIEQVQGLIERGLSADGEVEITHLDNGSIQVAFSERPLFGEKTVKRAFRINITQLEATNYKLVGVETGRYSAADPNKVVMPNSELTPGKYTAFRRADGSFAVLTPSGGFAEIYIPSSLLEGPIVVPIKKALEGGLRPGKYVIEETGTKIIADDSGGITVLDE